MAANRVLVLVFTICRYWLVVVFTICRYLCLEKLMYISVLALYRFPIYALCRLCDFILAYDVRQYFCFIVRPNELLLAFFSRTRTRHVKASLVDYVTADAANTRYV